MQFDGMKYHSITLRKCLKHLKDKLDKPCWFDILKNIIKVLDHIHNISILHNDPQSNNVLLEKQQEKRNPVIIDFGKARFISKLKLWMSWSSSTQERYHKLYPHIATEIVKETGQQSVASNVMFLTVCAWSAKWCHYAYYQKHLGTNVQTAFLGYQS